MRRILKWAGIVAAVPLGLAILAVAYVLIASQVILDRDHAKRPDPIRAAGGAAAAAANAPKQVAACAACHGGDGLGVDEPLDPKPPVLAGQHADYLEQALIQYRNGRRQNVVMRCMAQLLTGDADVKIAAAYYANQASPLTTSTATTASK